MPYKSSSSNNSGGAGNALSEEEDSHLITITERTYEESCTVMSTSGLSQVSVSQMLMDDIKQKLQSKNRGPRYNIHNSSSDKKNREPVNGSETRLDHASASLCPDEALVKRERNQTQVIDINGVNAHDHRESPQRSSDMREDTAMLDVDEAAGAGEGLHDEHLGSEAIGFESLLDDLNTAPLRNSAQFAPSSTSH